MLSTPNTGDGRMDDLIAHLIKYVYLIIVTVGRVVSRLIGAIMSKKPHHHNHHGGLPHEPKSEPEPDIHEGSTDWESVHKVGIVLDEYFRAQGWVVFINEGEVMAGNGGTRDLCITDLAKFVVGRRGDWSH
jgi:hypothetical protein